LALVYDPTGRYSSILREAAAALEEAGYRVATLRGGEIDGYKTLDQRDAASLIRDGGIGFVATTGDRPELDYRIRRGAADYGVPLILDHRLALHLSRAILDVDLDTLKPIRLRGYRAIVERKA